MSFLDKLFKKTDETEEDFFDFSRSEIESKDSTLTNEEKVLHLLNERVENSVIKNNCSLFIEDIKLRIEVVIIKSTENTAHIVYVLNHSSFSEDLIETCAGIGATTDIALEQAVESFCFCALESITNALKDKSTENFECIFLNKINKFKVYKSCIAFQGELETENEANDYLNIIRNHIKYRLGNKPVYWIKVYIAKVNDTINCECRINGIVSQSLSNLLMNVAETWNVRTSLYSEKQYFVFMQDKETFLPYKFTKHEVENYTLKTIELFKDCNSPEKYDVIYQQIMYFCQDSSLAFDLFSLIPELFFSFAFPEVMSSEEIILSRYGDSITLCKDQLSTYSWILDVVDDKFRIGNLTNQELTNIVSCSASFKAMNIALNNGSAIKDLILNPLILNIPIDYVIS